MLRTLTSVSITVAPPSWGVTFQTPQWMSETADGTETTYTVFSDTFTPILKFNFIYKLVTVRD